MARHAAQAMLADAHLTHRETAVLVNVALGYPHADIARRLSISTRVSEATLSRARAKVRAKMTRKNLRGRQS